MTNIASVCIWTSISLVAFTSSYPHKHIALLLLIITIKFYIHGVRLPGSTALTFFTIATVLEFILYCAGTAFVFQVL